MSGKECVICGKEINDGDSKRILAIDKPFPINFNCHKECLNKPEKELKQAIERFLGKSKKK